MPEGQTRGRAAPTRPWQQETRLVLGKPTPFVGREDELGRLEAAWPEGGPAVPK